MNILSILLKIMMDVHINMKHPKLRLIKGGNSPREVTNRPLYNLHKHKSICEDCMASRTCDIGRALYKVFRIAFLPELLNLK